MFKNDDIFLQVRKGKTLARLVNLVEDRDLLTPHHVHGIIRDRTIPVCNPLGSRHDLEIQETIKCIFSKREIVPKVKIPTGKTRV